MRPLAVLALAGCAGAPTYLHGYGPRAERSAALGWLLLAIASIVVLVVAALVLIGTLRRRGEATREVVRSDGGIRWIIVGGIIVPTVILFGVLAVSIRTLAATVSPPGKPALTVQVTGHRWWWEVRYPAEGIVTANEIHVPAGADVELRLTAADVIHAFWVPAFWSKIDANPGQVNEIWAKVDRPGVYFGQCTELCGARHGYMPIAVEVVPEAQFNAWVASKGGTLPGAKPAAVPAAAPAAAPATAPAEAEPAVAQPATNQAATAQN